MSLLNNYLLDFSVQIIAAIWPLSSITCRSGMGNKGILPLRTFIQETLRRSRTSYSTLQVTLYYLILIKPYVPEHDFTMEEPVRALQCGRRTFLSALILASKYLQDRNYSARAWNKISGLNTFRDQPKRSSISFCCRLADIYHRCCNPTLDRYCFEVYVITASVPRGRRNSRLESNHSPTQL